MEIFLPLIVGAKLVIASSEVVKDGFKLAKLIEIHNPTYLQATPATWQILLTAGWKGSSNLTIVSTGEAIAPELAHQLLPLGKKLWNLYGPTETTIWSTGYQIENTHEPLPLVIL